MAITIAELHAGPIAPTPRRHRPRKPLTKAAQRLRDERKERERLLLHEAHDRGLTAEAEAPGQYLVRDPGENGVVQVTTAFSCTCRQWVVWRRCPHVALIRSTEQKPEVQE